MGAIYVMWMRQMKRYWRSRGRMIGFLGQPLLFLLAFGFGFSHIYQQAAGGDYIQFLVPGIIAMTILFTSVFNGMEVIWDRQIGFLKEVLVSPQPRYRIFIGRVLGGATISLLQGIILFIISLFIGFRPTNMAMIPVAILLMFLVALLFSGFGIAIGSLFEDQQAFPVIINFVMNPLFFLSNALFPLDKVPQTLKIISIFNPLTYGVDGIRGALTGNSHFSLVLIFNILIFCIIIIGALGTYFFNRIEA